MAITLGSQAATQGADFSTAVSGAAGTLSLVNGGDGVFSFDGVNKLTARGDRLVPGVSTIVFNDATMTSGIPANTRASFDIIVARAGAAAALPSITVPATSAGATVSVTPATANAPTGTLYHLIDARGGNPINPTKLGVTFDSATGALTGTLAAGAGLFDVAIVGRTGPVEVSRSRRFSVYNNPTYVSPTGGAGPAPLPVLTLTGPLTIVAGAAAGTLVANIGNVPAGATPTVAPNDGRLAVAGDATNGWKVVVGLTASSAGTIALTAAAANATSASANVTVTAAQVYEAARFWLSGGGTTNSAGSVFQGESATLNVGTVQHVFELEGEFTEIQLILANQDNTDTQDYLGASMVAGTDLSDKKADSLFTNPAEVKTFAFGQNGNPIITVPARVNQNNQLALSDWVPISAKQRTDMATASPASKRIDGSLPFLLYVRLAIPIFKADGTTNRRATYINRTGADWATGRGQLWASSDVGAAPILTGAWAKNFSSSNEGFINYAILAGVRYKSKGKIMTIMAGGSSYTSGGSDDLKSHTGVQRGFQDASTAAAPVESVNYGMATNTADNASIGMIYALPIIKPTHVCWEYANPNSVGSWGSSQGSADGIEANLELRRQQVFTAAQNVGAVAFVVNGTPRNTDATTSYFTTTQDGYRLAALARLNGRGFAVADINAAVTDGTSPSRLKRTETGFAYNETGDFLHPNTAGYKKWANAVTPVVQTLKIAFGMSAPDPLPVQAATNRLFFHNEGVATTSSNNMDACRLRQVTGNAPLASVGMVFSTFYGPNTQGPGYLVRSHVEYNGVVVVCTYNGADSRQIISGENLVETDLIPASAFGVSEIPANAVLYIVTQREWVAGTNRINSGTPLLQTGEGTVRGPIGSTSKIGVAGAFNNSGTTWGDYSARFFGPVVVVGRPKSKMPAVITVGASIESGTADDANRGYCVRAAAIAPQYPSGIFSRGGETTVGYLAADGDSRRAFYKYFNVAINGYGGNDFSGGTTKETSAANMKTINAQLKAGGIMRIIQVRMAPKADTTDAYATTANQTVRTINGGFNVYRNYIDAQAALDPNVNTVADIASVQEPPSGPGKWAVNGVANYATSDGTHPSLDMHVLMTPPLRSAVNAQMEQL